MWVEKYYYPAFHYEYQLSKNKIEVLLNLLYYGLYADEDKERIFNNFTPFPTIFKNKDEHSYHYIENSFLTFISLESIDDLCSVYDLNRMREAFYNLDLMYGQMYDMFEWLISSTYSHIKEITDDVLIQSIHNTWKIPQSSNIHINKQADSDNIQYNRLLFEVNLNVNNENENNNEIIDLSMIEPQKVFHGTKVHCVHSILKNGLVIYSNTKNQIHGSVYGSGIYTSTDFNESYRYCDVNKNEYTWKQSKIKIEICMFLCDYYHNEKWGEKYSKLPNTFRIARENGYVIPRYLYIEYQ